MKEFFHRYSPILAAVILFLIIGGSLLGYALSSAPQKLEQDGTGGENENPDLGITEEVRDLGEDIVEAVMPEEEKEASPYFLHTNIHATLFWVGEKGDDDNKDIPNSRSAWDDDWKKHYGGFDDPEERGANYGPKDFSPQENPFYIALPYNDFDEDGERKEEAEKIVPWAQAKQWGEQESMLKNRWVKIEKNGKVAYAQWEDVGPFREDDGDYVFGKSEPASKTNKHAGIDLSPAVNAYLELKDVDTVSWQFVDEKDVPSGPWKKVITRSQINWN
jgi:hypothetical protein